MKENEDSDADVCFSGISGSASSENYESNELKKKDNSKQGKNININDIKLNNSNEKSDDNIDEEDDFNININNINTIKQCNSYKSVFSFANISKFDECLNNPNINNNNNNNDIIEENEEIRKSGINDNDISIWETIKQHVSNVKNHIIFNLNIFSGLNNLNLKDEKLPQEIQIFDQKFVKQDENLINVLKNIPWFSYRKNFNKIKEKDKIYTSDAGWGCMIRASQMILAQGIYKLFSMNNLHQFFNEFITFFYDNKIPLKLLVKKENNKNNDINNNNKIKKEKEEEKEEEETYEDFLIVDITRECRLSFIDVTKEMIKELELKSNEDNQQNFVTAPFSLRNIIKMQKKLNPNGKKVGQWFSNYDTVKILTKINEQMLEKNECDFKIISFENETIYIEDLIKECFEEAEMQGFENLSKSAFDTEIKNDTIQINDIANKKLNNETFNFNKRKYIFKQKFIIFISVRHGLHNLDEDIYKEVFKIFDIPTNIGLIGGKNSRAFYFIGRCANNLIFLDPHYVQQTIPLDALGKDKFEESYRPNDIYYMDISEISPSFSIGFAIKNINDFKLFMEKITSDDYFIDQKCDNSLGNKKVYLFMVKNFHFPYRNNDDSNQDISNNIDIKENYY